MRADLKSELPRDASVPPPAERPSADRRNGQAAARGPGYEARVTRRIDARIGAQEREAEIAATDAFLRGIFPFQTFPPDDPARGEGARLAFELLGLRWNLLIVRAVAAGAGRYAEIQRELGIPRKMLARRLKLLVAHGVLERIPYEARPPRFDYRLTTKGWDLFPAVALLAEWGERYMVGDDEGGGSATLDPGAASRQALELAVA